jgi:cobalt-zinc-cadmium efflux system protein
MKSKDNRLRTAFFLNLSFSIFEIFGGIFTNSIALLSDAVHDIGDSLSLGLSWFLQEKSKKKPDAKYTFGYARYSLLGGLISALVLIAGSTILIIEAIPRIINPQIVNLPWLIGFSIVGIVVNGLAAYKTASGHSLNEKMVSFHLFEDVFGWAALLISAIVMSIWDIPILDPLLSVFFTIFILSHVYKNIRAIFEIFLEKAPKHINLIEIQTILESHPSIQNIHHIHVWTLEGNLVLMTFHALMKSDLSKKEIIDAQSWMHEILSRAGIHHATIEVECNEECIEPDCPPTSGTVNHHHH